MPYGANSAQKECLKHNSARLCEVCSVPQLVPCISVCLRAGLKSWACGLAVQCFCSVSAPAVMAKPELWQDSFGFKRKASSQSDCYGSRRIPDPSGQARQSTAPTPYIGYCKCALPRPASSKGIQGVFYLGQHAPVRQRAATLHKRCKQQQSDLYHPL